MIGIFEPESSPYPGCASVVVETDHGIIRVALRWGTVTVEVKLTGAEASAFAGMLGGASREVRPLGGGT